MWRTAGHHHRLFICIVLAGVCCTLTTGFNHGGNDETILSRKKRFLVWQEGVNWVQLIAGIGLPTEIKDQSVTMGAVVKAFYLLPTNSSEYTMPSIDYARKKRSASRWALYSVIESFIERFGYGNGKACLLRTICDASSIPFDSKSGLLAEIAHALLTPSSSTDVVDKHIDLEYHSAEQLGKEVDRCEILYPECSFNFMQQFSRLLS